MAAFKHVVNERFYKWSFQHFLVKYLSILKTSILIFELYDTPIKFLYILQTYGEENGCGIMCQYMHDFQPNHLNRNQYFYSTFYAYPIIKPKHVTPFTLSLFLSALFLSFPRVFTLIFFFFFPFFFYLFNYLPLQITRHPFNYPNYVMKCSQFCLTLPL